MPDVISQADFLQKSGFRSVVLLSLASVLAAPGNFDNPKSSLQDSMTMFKQHALFKHVTIRRKLHDLILAELATKEEGATSEKHMKEKKHKKEKKDKCDHDEDESEEDPGKSKEKKKGKKDKKDKKMKSS